MAKESIKNQLNRMKSLMTYGLQTESKQAYSAIEYTRVGADGKTYGILREGTKYYIKVAPKKDNLVKEDFSYIGGFRNRKNNEYTSYGNAQKQFDLKMRSINEAYSNGKNIVIESWNPEKQQELSVEATENMRKEIIRERQIMQHAQMIMEGKKKGNNTKQEFNAVVGNTKGKGSETPDCKCDNGSCTKDYHGKNIKCKGGDPFCEKVTSECGLNESEVLGWNDNKDYLDKSHGTQIGSSAPFDNPKDKREGAVADEDGGEAVSSHTGKVNEGASMHDSDNQNTPTPGTGEIGDTAPFNGEKGKQIDESVIMEDEELDGLEDDAMADDVDGMDAETDMDTEDELDEPIGDDFEGGEDGYDDSDMDDETELDDDVDDDVYEDDVEDRLNNVEDLLMQIADKLGISQDVDTSEYEDDEDIYDIDMEDDADIEDDADMGDDMDGDMGEFDSEEDDDDADIHEAYNRNGYRIIETRNYRRLMNEENRLDDFGKHPAYQKKVMTYPTPDMNEFDGNYDMNDDSVKGEKPYGLKIGSSAPFTITPETIENAITESVRKIFRKKK